MKLLVVGGTGKVGSLILPTLAAAAEVEVLDLRTPERPVPGVVYHAGDACDHETVRRLSTGKDVLCHFAMGRLEGWGEPDNAVRHLHASVVSLYAALRAAAEAGVPKAVVASSMSVFNLRSERLPWPAEAEVPDAVDFYGLSKRLGEVVAETAAVATGMRVIALRLVLPTADDEWPRQTQPDPSTSATDTARAVLAAAADTGSGFDAVAISGDTTGRICNTGKALQLWGWRPGSARAGSPEEHTTATEEAP
ncbi:NAD-dependent epimerase/dehydratase family protein [Saccharopolyspora sp. NPDC002376]